MDDWEAVLAEMDAHRVRQRIPYFFLAQRMGISVEDARHLTRTTDLHLSTLRRYAMAIGVLITHEVGDHT